MNGFTFAAPYYLWALAALPILWWWLRLTPPQPQRQIFPPLALLAEIAPPAHEAAKNPWWLTALRLFLAALLILSAAQPMRSRSLPPLAPSKIWTLIIDNSWAAAPESARQKAAARSLIREIARQNSSSLIYIIPAAAAENAHIDSYTAGGALAFIDSLAYQPLPADRRQAFAKLKQIAAQTAAKPAGGGGGSLSAAYFSDGLAGAEDAQAFADVRALKFANLLLLSPQNSRFIGISAAENSADGLNFTVLRGEGGNLPPADGRIIAYDEKAQILGEQVFHFAKGETRAKGSFALPAEIRNDVNYLKLARAEAGSAAADKDGNPAYLNAAAALWGLGSGNKQRIVAILGPRPSQTAQPLLSPLYYAAKALEGAAGVAGGAALQADSGAMEQNIDGLLAAKPSLLIIGDKTALSPEAKRKLRQYVEGGGSLLRFGGASIANSGGGAAWGENGAEALDGEADSANAIANNPAADPSENLLPVRLRRGERSFGGALSGAKPQKIAPFAQNSPFYGLSAPQNVVILKQILAEPSADLADKSWISLTDGTPLMTAAPLGKGRLIFVHTDLEPGWSNLALSGFFVDMMQRLVAVSGPAAPSAAAGADKGEAGGDFLPRPQKFAPYRIISADGNLENAPDYVRPLDFSGKAPPHISYYTPPGLYGSRLNLYPLNLLNKDSRLAPLQAPPLPDLRIIPYSNEAETSFSTVLFIAAAVLFAADMVLNLALRGGFGSLLRQSGQGQGRLPIGKFRRLWPPKAHISCFAAALLGLALSSLSGLSGADRAAAAKLEPAAAENAAVLAGKTHLAYILSGDAALDRRTQAGLQNLSRFIERRTTIEPGESVGLDPEHDELAFYPLIYWPIDPQAPMPSAKAIANIDAYMRHGGTILFDTRDALQGGLQLDNAGPAALRLRAVLAGLNVPPLEPAPMSHVIARSFYIMPDFPGRYRNSPLWIAAAADGGGSRLIRAGDGISPILITANDFAGAWADDGTGGFLFPLIPDGEKQRLWAFRGGLNIVMYVLTGNYKADQIHIPELLRRLSP